MSEKFIIIDGNSLLNRAYYAVRMPMMTKEGIYTQGIYGFLNMLNKIFEEYNPEYMAVAWDLKGPTFRHKEYDAYKAGRRKMPMELAMEFPIMKEILSAMSIKNLSVEGFEADDIIGTLSRLADEEKMDTLVITGDKDAFQLVSEHTNILFTKKGISQYDLYDIEKMEERYGLSPEQFIDLKGLMGDSSDNIPGIPGIGEVTGIKLIKEFGSVANLISCVDNIEKEKLRLKVEEHAQQALMSRRLAEINRYAPIEFDKEDLRLHEPDYKSLIEIYERLEFKSFLKKLKMEDKQPDIEGSDDNYKEIKNHEIVEIENEEDLSNIALLDKAEYVYIFTESDFNHMSRATLNSIYLKACEADVIYKINIQKDVCGNLFELSGEKGLSPNKVVSFLNDLKLNLTGQNLQSQLYVLMQYGFSNYKVCFDLDVAVYVLSPLADDSIMNVPAFSRENISAYFYSVENEVKRLKLLISEHNLEKIYFDIELPLIEILASMENEGIRVDRRELTDMGKNLDRQINDVASSIFNMSGEEFNINSPLQLGNILFEKLGLPAGKKNKKGYSTSADVLEKLKDAHPIINLILEFRTLSKLKSTYITGLIDVIGDDEKIRAHFQQTVTSTGRLSCTKPNLQNIPIKLEQGRLIRKAFLPGEGNVLISADYSQIELRVLAHLSEDSNLINSFNNNEDIHRATASKVFNIPYDEVTMLDRSRAKAVNFGVIYGMSSFGLSEELNIPVKDAGKYIKDYFTRHEKVKEYMDRQIALCKENGYVTTIMGRRRYIKEVTASNAVIRMQGERLAMNTPIQGSAADIIKLAMIKVYNALKVNGCKSKLILQIHDELIIDMVKEEEEKVTKILIDNMTEAVNMKVKLMVDVHKGINLYETK